MSSTTKGFTIVELLIVIVVIAILAAITVVAFNGVQNRSRDSSVQADIRNTYSKIVQFHTLNGSYPATATDVNENFVVSSRSSYGGGNNFYSYCRSDTSFAIAVRSASGKGFAYSSQGGAIAFTSWPGDSHVNLCPAAGIPTTATGYAQNWIAANGAWATWFTPGS